MIAPARMQASKNASGVAAFSFEGFSSPNTTQAPDALFDELLSHLSEAELKALLYIIRRTFGFRRDADSISFNQFLRGIVTKDGRQLDCGCGVRNRTALSKALSGLEDKGIILVQRSQDERGEHQTTVYRLHFKGESKQQGVVRQTYQG